MIGYISLEKDNGRRAWIRIDEIAAFTENEAKVDGAMVQCTTVLMRNNVAWHFPGVTGHQLLGLMKSACGTQINVVTETGLP